MPEYPVFFKPSADRQLRKLPADVGRRIAGEVATLAVNPDPPAW